MTINDKSPLFSRTSDDWETPSDLYMALDREFGFTCDVAASDGNAKHRNFLSIASNALSAPWSGVCFCNPPYSKTKEFLKAAIDSVCLGTTSIILIPSRTDTKYWHELVAQADEVRFLKGRVKFIGAKHGDSINSAPFPSALVIYRPRASNNRTSPTKYWCWDWRAKG